MENRDGGMEVCRFEGFQRLDDSKTLRYTEIDLQSVRGNEKFL